MQHNLATQYETAWAVADLVATHGTHDFRSGENGVHRVIWLCGLKVYVENNLPIRFVAANLDLALVRDAGVQPFTSVLSGPVFRDVHDILSSTYTLRFDRGDLGTLQGWHDQLTAFVAATAVRQAA